jgi:hypothetical protein
MQAQVVFTDALLGDGYVVRDEEVFAPYTNRALYITLDQPFALPRGSILLFPETLVTETKTRIPVSEPLVESTPVFHTVGATLPLVVRYAVPREPLHANGKSQFNRTY